MKIFHCDHCSHLAFFENIQCLRCGHALAYLPDFRFVGSIERQEDGRWHSPLARARGRRYRLCENYAKENVCNWVVSDDDAHSLCVSCRLTRVIPQLDQPGNASRWYRLEVAKRRLVYTLQSLELPLANRDDDPERGLAFEFKADALTGHGNGVISVNIAEADDVEREKRRVQFREPYRTLLGHFRHESGHYYWDRLIKDDLHRLDTFRATFGDERRDYAEALARHHQQGPPADWHDCAVSAYASAHPWEDWAETWAHYLHMIDALEMADACGLSLQPGRQEDPHIDPLSISLRERFDAMIGAWFSLTYVLNNLNRGLGLPDGYPFVLPAPAIAKVRFVHDIIAAASRAG